MLLGEVGAFWELCLWNYLVSGEKLKIVGRLLCCGFSWRLCAWLRLSCFLGVDRFL